MNVANGPIVRVGIEFNALKKNRRHKISEKHLSGIHRVTIYYPVYKSHASFI
jgi:hypothetical protein